MTNCPNCGAPIQGTRCEYCGTPFYDLAAIDMDNPGYITMMKGAHKFVFKAFVYNAEIEFPPPDTICAEALDGHIRYISTESNPLIHIDLQVVEGK